MPNRPFYPAPHELRAALDGRLGRVVVPIWPQPVMRPGVNPGFSQLRAYRHGFDTWMLHGSGEASEPFKLPFAPGDVLLAKEAYALLPRTAYRMSIGTGTIAQREHPTDGYTAAVFRVGFDRSGRPPWRSPVTMPAWAVRVRLRVGQVDVKRVTELTPADAIACGFRPYANSQTIDCDTRNPLDDFKEAWNRRYACKGLAYDQRPWVASCAVTVEMRDD